MTEPEGSQTKYSYVSLNYTETVTPYYTLLSVERKRLQVA